MDVEALRSAVASLRSTVDRTCEEWSAVGTKASLALVSIHTTNQALHAQVPRLGELAAELESRVDLVELLNSDANGRFRTPAAGHQVTVDVNGAWPSGSARRWRSSRPARTPGPPKAWQPWRNGSAGTRGTRSR